MDATPQTNSQTENQTQGRVDEKHAHLMYEEQYAGVAFMFDRMNKLARPERNL